MKPFRPIETALARYVFVNLDAEWDGQDRETVDPTLIAGWSASHVYRGHDRKLSPCPISKIDDVQPGDHVWLLVGDVFARWVPVRVEVAE